MKIVLISPKGPLYRHRGGIFKKSLRYAPLTLTTLASLIPEELNANVTLIDEGVEDIPPNLEADLVAMTVITGSAMRAYELSEDFRNRGIPVILGGPHVTLIPEDAQRHADSIVIGYAEDTWPKLLRDFVDGRLQPRYIQDPDMSLAGRPFPKRNLVKANRYLTTNVFEATRSCVHDCDFCVAPAAWGRKPYLKPVQDLVDDIKSHGAKKLLFIDLNLISDKEHAKKLFESLIPMNVQWFGLSTVLLVHDRPLLKLAAKSGCRGLLMGLESISQDNLENSRKGFNSPEEYKSMVKLLHDHGISLMGCFVFGLDQDTPDIFLKTAEFVIEANIDLPRFAIVTPFPGTRLHRRLESEGRILTRNWELYDGQHVVFQPKNMSAEQLLEGHETVWKHVYRFSSIFKRLYGSGLWQPGCFAANLGYRFYSHHLHRHHQADMFRKHPMQNDIMNIQASR